MIGMQHTMSCVLEPKNSDNAQAMRALSTQSAVQMLLRFKSLHPLVVMTNGARGSSDAMQIVVPME